VLYNEKFAKPGTAIMKALADQGLVTKTQFDEEIEWTWFYLWHHEGRRARHGASMMAPDYAHWHGMYEVAERFYKELIPQARELAEKGEKAGKKDQAHAVQKVIDDILKRPEHLWFTQGGVSPAAASLKAPAKAADAPAKPAELAKPAEAPAAVKKEDSGSKDAGGKK